MKTAALWVALGLVLLWTGPAQAGPDLKMESKSIDAGEAFAGQKLKVDYQLTNVGDKALKIKKVSPG